jgi:serine/threonine-protein kinase SRPK3
VQTWSDDDVYYNLGVPETDEVFTHDGSLVKPCAPAQVVAPVGNACLTHAALLSEDIVVIDFGQSFAVADRPADYVPAAPVHYLPPESYFESRFDPASDVWALACTLFEIRAGSLSSIPSLVVG